MLDLDPLGKILIVLGLFLLLLGLFFIFIKQIPFLGKLPGDIIIQRKNFTFYFPLTTSILISILLSLIFYFLGKK
ncbi:MAG: DUF2905 domain-containing protein [Calditrichaeota bacterium]|nr:MAG: DUF2905 domain-containing protein [Calditrichota bacterium]